MRLLRISVGAIAVVALAFIAFWPAKVSILIALLQSALAGGGGFTLPLLVLLAIAPKTLLRLFSKPEDS